MSSLYDYSTVASNAVDGNLDSQWKKCAITKMDTTSPWLLVDLLFEYHILYVRIKNRNCPCYTRSQPFDVRVGNNNQNGGIYNAFCVQQGSIPTQNTMKIFDCLRAQEVVTSAFIHHRISHILRYANLKRMVSKFRVRLAKNLNFYKAGKVAVILRVCCYYRITSRKIVLYSTYALDVEETFYAEMLHCYLQ